MVSIAKLIVIGLLLSTAAWADDDWGEHRHGHHDHGRHHGHHYGYGYDYYPSYREEIVYVPQPIVEYVPVQPHYYAPPPPPVSYYQYDQRSPQGLVGGMLGSVMGYEMGRGDPLAAGIGAAAGAWLGNGMY